MNKVVQRNCCTRCRRLAPRLVQWRKRVGKVCEECAVELSLDAEDSYREALS